MNENRIGVAEHKHLLPLEKIKGYDVRPGFMGLMELRHSERESALQSVLWKQQMWSSFLYHRGERKPYAVLPFPEALPDRKGLFHVCFRTDIYDFEYAYRVNGPYDPQKGLIFDKKKPLLDPYARAVTGQSVLG